MSAGGAAKAARRTAFDARWERRIDDVARVLGEAEAGLLELAVQLGDEARAREIIDRYLARRGSSR